MKAIYSGQAEMMARLHQLTPIIQQGPVRQYAHPLSMHSQVEPDGFSSQTTRVGLTLYTIIDT